MDIINIKAVHSTLSQPRTNVSNCLLLTLKEDSFKTLEFVTAMNFYYSLCPDILILK